MMNLYENLKLNGIETKLLSAKGEFFGYFGHKDRIDDNDVLYYNSLVSAKKKSLSNSTPNKKSGLKSLLVDFLKMHLVIPDYTTLDIYNAYTKAKVIIEKEGINVIVISVPKHGISLVALLLRLKFGNRVKIILDYRDGWNTQPIFKMGNPVSQAISVFLEKKVINAVDHITYVSPVVISMLESKFDLELKERSTLIYNGFEKNNSRNEHNQICYDKDNIRLVYFGSATDSESSYRNVEFLIDFVRQNKHIKLDFYGELVITRINLDDIENVNYKGVVDTKKLVDLARNYDWSCIVHTDEESAREVIPGKFYDSINLKLPALCLVPPSCQVSLMVEEHKIGLCVEPNLDSLNESLALIENKDKYFSFVSNLHSEELNFFERKVQMKRFSQLIGNIFGKKID